MMNSLFFFSDTIWLKNIISFYLLKVVFKYCLCVHEQKCYRPTQLYNLPIGSGKRMALPQVNID